MARCLFFFVVKCICFFTCLCYVKCKINKHAPIISSLTVLSKTAHNLSIDTGVNYFLKVEGVNLNPRMVIRPTTQTRAKGKHCIFDEDPVAFLYPHFFNDTVGYFSAIVVSSEFHKPLYFCVGTADAALKPSISAYRGEVIKWIHQGQNIFLLNDNSQVSANGGPFYLNSRLESN